MKTKKVLYVMKPYTSVYKDSNQCVYPPTCTFIWV